MPRQRRACNNIVEFASVYEELLKLHKNQEVTQSPGHCSIEFIKGRQACLRSVFSLIPEAILKQLIYLELGPYGQARSQPKQIWPGPIDILAEAMATCIDSSDSDTLFLGNVTDSPCVFEEIHHRLCIAAQSQPVYFVGYFLCGRQWYSFRFFHQDNSKETLVNVYDSLLDCRKLQYNQSIGTRNRRQSLIKVSPNVKRHIENIHQELSTFYSTPAKLSISIARCPQQAYDSEDSGVILLHCLDNLITGTPWEFRPHSPSTTDLASQIVDGDELRLKALQVLCSLGRGEQSTLEWGNLFQVTLKDNEIQSSKGSYFRDTTWIPEHELDQSALSAMTQACGTACTQPQHQSNEARHTYLDWFLNEDLGSILQSDPKEIAESSISPSDSDQDSLQEDAVEFNVPFSDFSPDYDAYSDCESAEIEWENNDFLDDDDFLSLSTRFCGEAGVEDLESLAETAEQLEVLRAIQEGTLLPLLNEEELVFRQKQILNTPDLKNWKQENQITRMQMDQFLASYHSIDEDPILDGKFNPCSPSLKHINHDIRIRARMSYKIQNSCYRIFS